MLLVSRSRADSDGTLARRSRTPSSSASGPASASSTRRASPARSSAARASSSRTTARSPRPSRSSSTTLRRAKCAAHCEPQPPKLGGAPSPRRSCSSTSPLPRLPLSHHDLLQRRLDTLDTLQPHSAPPPSLIFIERCRLASPARLSSRRVRRAGEGGMTGVLGRESSARWTRWYLWIRGGGRSAMQTGIVPADRQTSSRSRDCASSALARSRPTASSLASCSTREATDEDGDAGRGLERTRRREHNLGERGGLQQHERERRSKRREGEHIMSV